MRKKPPKPDSICGACGKNIAKVNSIVTKRKSKKIFCSKKCELSFNTKYKRYGGKRSYLEIFIEKQLDVKYPTLKIQYNKKTLIDSELDIYIPTLKIGIEINGIYHYKPIYGESKLKYIKKNDRRKLYECKKRNVKLFIVNTNRWKKRTDEDYLNDVIKIINKGLINK